MSAPPRCRIRTFAWALASAAGLACGVNIVGSVNEPGPDAGETPPDERRPPASVEDAALVIDVVSDAGTDAPDVASEAGCPGRAGPAMVDVGGYCIDTTEVTEAQYAAFLAADAGYQARDAGFSTVADASSDAAAANACSWKTTSEPGITNQKCRWDPAQFPSLPVVCVDWCDADAYCRWAGKRLCGAIGGGAIPWTGTDYIDASTDQWYRACSKGGVTRYPYGQTFHAEACNVKERDAGAVIDAGALPGCIGAYDGLRDMVGNAFEFEDSCSGTTSKTDLCRLRGGSWFHDDAFGNCLAYGAGNQRDARFDDIGFRCCSP